MAMNPMQRKIRNSFLFGFLVAVIVAAIVVGLLFMKIKGLNENIVALQTETKIATTQVYVACDNLKMNQTLIADNNLMLKDGEENSTNRQAIELVDIPTNLVPENALTEENKDNYAVEWEKDPDTGEKIATAYNMRIKCDLSKGSIITTDLVEKSQEYTSYRLVEYTMISLPSKLKEGDFIDIRLALAPEGVDYIVLSKIKVEEATTNSIWLKVSEGQLQLLNNAIVESYIIEGSKLYATQYIDAAQAQLSETYIPNGNIAELIRANAMTDVDRGIVDKQDDIGLRNYIEGILEQYSNDEKTSKVQEGFTTEKTTIQAAREALLGDMGY